MAVFLLVVLVALAGLVAFPKSYHVEAKLLAQRNAALSVRGDSNGADAPTRAAAETVLRHDNLVAVVRATDLVENYASHMAPAQRLRAAIDGLMKPYGSDQDRVEGMVDLLATQFNVWSNEGTVTIAIDWPNAKMAYRLVDYAQQSFLEARHIQEISSTAESVGILQGHAMALRADVDTAVEAIKKLREDRTAARPRERDDRAPPTLVPGESPSAGFSRFAEQSDLTRLRVLIDAKQRASDDLDDVRRRRLSELQAHLVEQKAIYTVNHPSVIDLEQTIASFSVESPQVTALRGEVSQLRAEIERRAPSQRGAEKGHASVVGAVTNVRTLPMQLPADIVAFEMGPPEERDPAMVYARGQLRDAMERYGALRSQIQAAQIDLETTEAAFKYRYAVVTPAQVPKRPSKPNVLLVILAAIVGGILAGLLAAVLADVRSGRLIERWQVELVLDRPILGEVDLPALPPGLES